MSTRMRGARFIAEMLHGYGVTHVFFVEAILRRTLMELESLGVRRVLTHSEKAAAYMADGYARAGRKPGVCMAQAVGAANLASGLQEPLLGRAPVIALTGRPASDLAAASDIEICTSAGEWSDRIQELHIKVVHILVDLIERRLGMAVR